MDGIHIWIISIMEKIYACPMAKESGSGTSLVVYMAYIKSSDDI